MLESTTEYKKDGFLIITHDKSILDPSLPAGKFISDIGSVVSELHIILISSKKQDPQKINGNTWVYTARRIPLVSYFSVYSIVRSQLIWKNRFLPRIVVSIGDEIKIAKRISNRFHRPLYVFYSYMKVLGKGGVSLGNVLDAKPKKIFTPNSYVAEAIEKHKNYKPTETEVKLIMQYIDVSTLGNLLDTKNPEEDSTSRNRIFSVITFPRNANIYCFKMIKNMSKEILLSIAKFQFVVVVKPDQYWQAQILRSFFKLPIILYKEDRDSVNLFRKSRVMVYFDEPTIAYDPILYSFIAGCPVLSTGDEYSKIILFNSGLEEYSHMSRDYKVFGSTIRRFINDPYTYTKYKVNCIGFAKAAFTHDRSKYIAELKDILNAGI